jgi:hypothetical protein
MTSVEWLDGLCRLALIAVLCGVERFPFSDER